MIDQAFCLAYHLFAVEGERTCDLAFAIFVGYAFRHTFLACKRDVSDCETRAEVGRHLCEHGDGGIRVAKVYADDGWRRDLDGRLCVSVWDWAVVRHVWATATSTLMTFFRCPSARRMIFSGAEVSVGECYQIAIRWTNQLAMARMRERLQAVQNSLQSAHGPIDLFLLPDRTRVHIVSAEILVDDVPVCTYQSLDRTAALLLSAVGTPHEHIATHVPSYPVLEIRPPSSTRQITVQDAWAIIYALFVRYHERETIPIILSTEIDNRADLCTYVLLSGLGRTALGKRVNTDDLFLSRAAFWQGAGTHGYHPRGWLPPLSSSTRHAASPFPLVQSFTRTPLVISAHPLRPPKPLPGEVLYRRYCPNVKQTLEFTYFDFGQDGQVTPHLEALHKWHNDDRVNNGWNERGSLEQHRQYVHGVLNNPAVLPIMMSWDGELMGYLELVYVKVRCY